MLLQNKVAEENVIKIWLIQKIITNNSYEFFVSKGSFTLCDFSKRLECDFLLAMMDTDIFNRTIHNKRFSQKNHFEKWVLDPIAKPSHK